MTKQDVAQAYFGKGYNCSQSVLMAFAGELGLSEAQAARLGAPFGGGVARMRDLCGAVSGMTIAAGLLCGFEDPLDAESRHAHYALIRGMVARFQKENGAYVCRELLEANPQPEPEPGAPAPAHNPACVTFVRDAAALVDALIQAQKKEA